jgi:uncharacterized protein
VVARELNERIRFSVRPISEGQNILLMILILIICGSLYFGYAGDMYGLISRAPQMLIVVAIILFQVLLSRWWLKNYLYGPLEWLWRSMTYLKVLPMRIKTISS